jgi:hypothetical protein
VVTASRASRSLLSSAVAVLWINCAHAPVSPQTTNADSQQRCVTSIHIEGVLTTERNATHVSILAKRPDLFRLEMSTFAGSVVTVTGTNGHLEVSDIGSNTFRSGTVATCLNELLAGLDLDLVTLLVGGAIVATGTSQSHRRIAEQISLHDGDVVRDDVITASSSTVPSKLILRIESSHRRCMIDATCGRICAPEAFTIVFNDHEYKLRAQRTEMNVPVDVSAFRQTPAPGANVASCN